MDLCERSIYVDIKHEFQVDHIFSYQIPLNKFLIKFHLVYSHSEYNVHREDMNKVRLL